MTERKAKDGPDFERLFAVEHRTVSYVSGPLLVAERAGDAGYDEMVDVVTPAGETRRGQVLEVEGDKMVVQVLGGTRGLNRPGTTVRTTGEVAKTAVGPDLIGRILDGSGHPVDGGPPLQPAAYQSVNGQPLNPYARAHPSDFIETGISAIDGLNTLVRGQKLPIFGGFGLPASVEQSFAFLVDALDATLRSSTVTRATATG